YGAHPLRKFYDAGVKVTLGSDDPPFFFTSLAAEYQRAEEVFGFTPEELRGLTRTAIEAAFVDDGIKADLFAKL
nr:hypothetical protein [Pseudomonadales bacterium]